MSRIDRLHRQVYRAERELYRAQFTQSSDEARAMVRKELQRMWDFMERIEDRHSVETPIAWFDRLDAPDDDDRPLGLAARRAI